MWYDVVFTGFWKAGWLIYLLKCVPNYCWSMVGQHVPQEDIPQLSHKLSVPKPQTGINEPNVLFFAPTHGIVAGSSRISRQSCVQIRGW